MVLVEIEKKVQEIKEITRSPRGDDWLASILLTIMDKDTKTNVSGTKTTETNFSSLQDKARAYATLMGASTARKGRLLWR